MWELWWQASPATDLHLGPLTWVHTFGGYGLLGSYLPTPPNAPPETRLSGRLTSGAWPGPLRAHKLTEEVVAFPCQLRDAEIAQVS
jgi:hypothetical protein